MESVQTLAATRTRRILSLARRAALCGLLSVAIVAAGMPQGAQAQAAEPASPSYATQAGAMADGERDAQAETNGVAWLAVGCLVGVLGVVIGYVVEPSPPPTRLLGKSPDYVMAYTQSYKYAGKQAQGKKALVGCLVGTAAVAVVYVIVLSAAASSSGTTY
jgi:hypothetical protein